MKILGQKSNKILTESSFDTEINETTLKKT